MIQVGIEKIDLYTGPLSLSIKDLAESREQDYQPLLDKLMCAQRSVYPHWEDPVTIAVNAANRLLEKQDKRDIELLIVATESSVDFSKPISTWVHRFCKLPATCRNFEIKHACYSGTAALKMAASWVASGVRPGKKALVVTADFSRKHIGSEAEFICGGTAIATLVGEKPAVLEWEMEKAGYWTHEVSDTFRPTSKAEVGNNQTSLYSYLDALEGSYEHFEKVVGAINYENYFKKHIYHAPFPSMTSHAHRTILGRKSEWNKQEIESHFQEKVRDSLHFSELVGSVYGSSNLLCLMSLLEHAPEISSGDRISFFSYGSGCQGEFYSGIVGNQGPEIVKALNIPSRLAERHNVSVEEYETIENKREAAIDLQDYEVATEKLGPLYDEFYDQKKLLVLKGIKNYVRKYAWS